MKKDMSNHEMFGAEEDWPCDAIKRDDLWCQVRLNEGGTKILPKKDVKVIQSGTE